MCEGSLEVCSSVLFFFFKQKTAYEMRISDGSSDVCSSDLGGHAARRQRARTPLGRAHGPQFPVQTLRRGNGDRSLGAGGRGPFHGDHLHAQDNAGTARAGKGGGPGRRRRQSPLRPRRDRKSVVEGKRVSVRVNLGGRRIIKKKNYNNILKQ